MTCVAVMVVPLVVPRTRTVSPTEMALAEVELVPFRYVVEDAWLTVTFSPVAVDTVKLDVDTLSTVPAVPPAAGPDRALDATPEDAGPLGAALDVLLLELEAWVEQPPIATRDNDGAYSDGAGELLSGTHWQTDPLDGLQRVGRNQSHTADACRALSPASVPHCC